MPYEISDMIDDMSENTLRECKDGYLTKEKLVKRLYRLATFAQERTGEEWETYTDKDLPR